MNNNNNNNNNTIKNDVESSEEEDDTHYMKPFIRWNDMKYSTVKFDPNQKDSSSIYQTFKIILFLSILLITVSIYVSVLIYTGKKDNNFKRYNENFHWNLSRELEENQTTFSQYLHQFVLPNLTIDVCSNSKNYFCGSYNNKGITMNGRKKEILNRIKKNLKEFPPFNQKNKSHETLFNFSMISRYYHQCLQSKRQSINTKYYVRNITYSIIYKLIEVEIFKDYVNTTPIKSTKDMFKSLDYSTYGSILGEMSRNQSNLFYRIIPKSSLESVASKDNETIQIMNSLDFCSFLSSFERSNISRMFHLKKYFVQIQTDILPIIHHVLHKIIEENENVKLQQHYKGSITKIFKYFEEIQKSIGEIIEKIEPIKKNKLKDHKTFVNFSLKLLFGDLVDNCLIHMNEKNTLNYSPNFSIFTDMPFVLMNSFDVYMTNSSTDSFLFFLKQSQTNFAHKFLLSYIVGYFNDALYETDGNKIRDALKINSSITYRLPSPINYYVGVLNAPKFNSSYIMKVSYPLRLIHHEFENKSNSFNLIKRIFQVLIIHLGNVLANSIVNSNEYRYNDTIIEKKLNGTNYQIDLHLHEPFTILPLYVTSCGQPCNEMNNPFLPHQGDSVEDICLHKITHPFSFLSKLLLINHSWKPITEKRANILSSTKIFSLYFLQQYRTILQKFLVYFQKYFEKLKSDSQCAYRLKCLIRIRLSLIFNKIHNIVLVRFNIFPILNYVPMRNFDNYQLLQILEWFTKTVINLKCPNSKNNLTMSSGNITTENELSKNSKQNCDKVYEEIRKNILKLIEIIDKNEKLSEINFSEKNIKQFCNKNKKDDYIHNGQLCNECYFHMNLTLKPLEFIENIMNRMFYSIRNIDDSSFIQDHIDMARKNIINQLDYRIQYRYYKLKNSIDIHSNLMQIYQVKYVESISNYAIAGQYYDMDAMYNYRTNSFYIQPEILITTSATPNDHFDKLSYNAREDFEDFFVKWKTRIKRIEITSRKGNISLIEKSLRQFRPLLLEMAKLNTPLQILSHEYMHLLQSQLSSTFPNTICHFDHVQFSQKSILRQIIRKVKMRNNHDKYRTYLQQSVEETLADTCSVQLIYNIFWKQIIDIGKDLMNISKHFQNFYEFLIKTFLFSLFSTRCWHESQFDYFGYDIIHESSMDRVQTLFDYSNDEWKSIFGCSPNTTNSVYHISKNISNKPISIFFAQFFNKSSESVNMDSCILSGIDF